VRLVEVPKAENLFQVRDDEGVLLGHVRGDPCDHEECSPSGLHWTAVSESKYGAIFRFRSAESAAEYLVSSMKP
jgi:hypothetical protein